MHVLVWQFRVRAGCEAEFERAYGPAGEWARLFARAGGYAGTELLRDAAAPGRYLTIDRWASAGDLDRFKADHRDDYEALDAACIEWTEEETALGAFTVAT
jgi:heme-degrading monooxygenase HmoA